jgi:hypothetical protein
MDQDFLSPDRALGCQENVLTLGPRPYSFFLKICQSPAHFLIQTREYAFCHMGSLENKGANCLAQKIF